MPIELEMPDGPPVVLDYAGMIMNAGAPDASIDDPQKIFWLGKINDFLVSQGNMGSREISYFLSETLSLTALLRANASPEKISESFAKIRRDYIDPAGAFGLSLPSGERVGAFRAIDAYLAAPSAAALTEAQTALTAAIRAIESDFNNSIRRDYLKSERFDRDREAYKTFGTRPRSDGDVGRRRSPAMSGGSPVGRARPVFNPLALGGAEIAQNIVDSIDDAGWQEIERMVERQIRSEVRALLQNEADLSRFSVEGVAEQLASQRNTPLENLLRQMLFDSISAIAASSPDPNIQAQFDTLNRNYSPPEIFRLFDATVINEQYRSLIEKAEGGDSYLKLSVQKTALEIKRHWVAQQDPAHIDSLDADIQLFVGQTQEEISQQTTELANLETQLKAVSEGSAAHADLKQQIDRVVQEIERKQRDVEDAEKRREDLVENEKDYSERREATERKLNERRAEVFAR